MPLEPLANRECGPCNVCCKVATIREPTFKKAPGVLCSHWADGCTIYEQRPGSCRGHFCAWRRLEQLDDSWRPDISNVVVEVKVEPYERFRHEMPDALLAMKFTVLCSLDPQRSAILMATIASLIADDVPVILAVAAPPEHMGGYKLLNRDLKPVVMSPDFAPRFVEIYRTLLAVPPRRVPLE